MAKPENNEEFRYLVRIGNTDLEGKKRLAYALRKIKGVNYTFANALCQVAKIDKEKKTGDLSENEIEKLNEVLSSPLNFGVPSWVVNRRNDYETGKDMHLITGDLTFVKGNDIKRLRKIKSYRGFRHAKGLPSRGQRTKSNFRRNKGKSLGVTKKR